MAGRVKPSAEAAGVVEELSDGDLVAVGHARNPVGDVVVEGDLALPDQLQDEVGGERLGLAGDLELHVGVQRLPGDEIGDASRADKRYPSGSRWRSELPGSGSCPGTERTISCTLASVCAGRGPLAVVFIRRRGSLLPQPEPNNDSTANQAPISAR